MYKYLIEYLRQFRYTNPLPFIAFSCFCLIANPLLFYAIENSRLTQMGADLFFYFFAIMVSGWVFGQIVMLNVISGLGGRHWVNGFALAIALGASGAMLVMVCNLRPNLSSSVFSSFWCLPAAILIASLPHLAMRLIRRWRISDSDQSPFPIRIEDYFIMMAILGSSIALCRAHYAIVMSDRGMGGFSGEFGFVWLYFGCVYSAINLLSLPAIALAFRPVHFVIRLAFAAGYTIIVWIVMIAILAIFAGFTGNFGNNGEVFLYLLGIVGTAVLVTNVGIQFLRLSGFWLWSKRDDQPRRASPAVPSRTRRADTKLATPIPSPAKEAIDPFSDEAESLAEVRATRKKGLDGSQMLARWLTVGLVLFALIANLFAFTYTFGADQNQNFDNFSKMKEETPAVPSD